jgi:hypothetical protein
MTAPIGQLDDRTNFGNQPGDGPLRPAGRSFAGLPDAKEADVPSTRSKRSSAQMTDLSFVRDCAEGPSKIRDAAQLYLPQDPAEKTDAYQSRLTRSVFFNVFGETVEALTGLVFAKDPMIGDDVPPVIVEHLENIDNAGTHFDVFAAELFQDALIAGHNGILVDFPNTGGTQTKAPELMGEVRPYWVPIRKEDIMSWRTDVILGKTVLTQIVFRECRSEAVGNFGEVDVTRYRVLYRDENGAIRGALLRVMDDKKTVVTEREWDYPTQTEIPFAEDVTAGRKSMLESKPPLLDLAYKNVEHYQLCSDRATSVHMTCVPIWVETGIDPDPTINGQVAPQAISLGPNSARRFKNVGAKAGYQSHDGAALGEVTKVIIESKSDMAVLGLSMLSPQTRVAETAEAKRMDKSASDSKLSKSARGLQDCLERALGFHAKYLKLPDGGSISINRDFNATIMDAQTMTAWSNLATALGIPTRTMLDILQKGGLIDKSDVELDDLANEIEANAAAKADQARADMQMQLAAKAKQPVVAQGAA